MDKSELTNEIDSKKSIRVNDTPLQSSISWENFNNFIIIYKKYFTLMYIFIIFDVKVQFNKK